MKFFAVIILFFGIVGLIAPAEGSSSTVTFETPTTTTSTPPVELPCGPAGPCGQAPPRPCAGGIASGKKLYFFY